MKFMTRAQVREVDRRAIEEFGVPGILLMENAAIGAAEVAWEMVCGIERAAIDVVCGGGNNGGDGLAMARHLHNRGVVVRVLLAVDPGRFKGDALINWRIVESMQLPVEREAVRALREGRRNLVVDALFGTGLEKSPRADAMEVIEAINGQNAPVLAVDVPSGLDCDTGKALGRDAVRAKITVTFVGTKVGFEQAGANALTGEVRVVGIGCPLEILERVERGE